VRALVYSPLAPVSEVVYFVLVPNFAVRVRLPSPAPALDFIGFETGQMKANMKSLIYA